jgi:hypothetical protein
LCEPLETTANGKRLVVEDSAACQKTIQTPVAQQVLKTDGAGNLTWTNGASGTVLRKDSTGLVEFATLNSVLQSGLVDLGSQPLTTTGAVSVGSLASTGAINAASVTTTGVITGTSAIFNAPIQVESTITIGRQNSTNEGGEIRIRKALDNEVSWFIDVYGSTSTPSLRLVEQTSPTTSVTRFEFKTNGTINITTITTYANNAAALAGGLVVGDVYKTSTGELRIVV